MANQFYQGKDSRTCPICHKTVSRRRYKEHQDKHAEKYISKRNHPTNGLGWY